MLDKLVKEVKDRIKRSVRGVYSVIGAQCQEQYHTFKECLLAVIYYGVGIGIMNPTGRCIYASVGSFR